MSTSQESYSSVNIVAETSNLLTVTRGDKFDDELIEKRIREVLRKPKLLDKILLKVKASKGNYSGAFYSNYFRVDRPIRLIDLGFFGPCEAEEARYVVHIEIFVPRQGSKKVYPSQSSGTRIASMRKVIPAKKGLNFYVEPSHGGIEIKPGVWYLIQFMLDGPQTFRCEKTVTSTKVMNGDNEINFEFDVGSMQMPSIRFTTI